MRSPCPAAVLYFWTFVRSNITMAASYARDPILRFRAFHGGILLNAVKNLSGLILIDVAAPFVHAWFIKFSARGKQGEASKARLKMVALIKVEFAWSGLKEMRNLVARLTMKQTSEKLVYNFWCNLERNITRIFRISYLWKKCEKELNNFSW